MLFFLSDYQYSNYARPVGAKDKQKRKSRLLRNVAIGAGGLALAGGLGYLALKGKAVKPSGGSSSLGGGSSTSTARPSVSTSTSSNKPEVTRKLFDDIDIKLELPESKPIIEKAKPSFQDYKPPVKSEVDVFPPDKVKSKLELRQDASKTRYDGTKTQLDELAKAKKEYKSMKSNPERHAAWKKTRDQVRSGNITQEARDNYVRRKKEAKVRGEVYGRELSESKRNIKKAQANLRNRSKQLGLFSFNSSNIFFLSDYRTYRNYINL